MSGFELWLEFEHWESKPDDDLSNDFFNMTIELEDGSKYALNVWTFDFLNNARYPWPHKQGTGEKANYVLPPDLFIDRMERSLIEKIVSELIESDQLQSEWEITEDERE